MRKLSYILIEMATFHFFFEIQMFCNFSYFHQTYENVNVLIKITFMFYFYFVHKHLVVETLGRVHLITEYIPGGELYYKIVQNGIYTEDKASIMFKQVALAVQHMVR